VIDFIENLMRIGTRLISWTDERRGNDPTQLNEHDFLHVVLKFMYPVIAIKNLNRVWKQQGIIGLGLD
jgi:hypothetical protein